VISVRFSEILSYSSRNFYNSFRGNQGSSGTSKKELGFFKANRTLGNMFFLSLQRSTLKQFPLSDKLPNSQVNTTNE